MNYVINFTFEQLNDVISMLLQYELFQLLFFIPILTLVIIVIKKIL